MSDQFGREDDRETLTNEDIKADLKREFRQDTIARAALLILFLLLVLAFVQLCHHAAELPLVFWLATLIFCALAGCAVGLFTVGIVHAVTYFAPYIATASTSRGTN